MPTAEAIRHHYLLRLVFKNALCLQLYHFSIILAHRNHAISFALDTDTNAPSQIPYDDHDASEQGKLDLPRFCGKQKYVVTSSVSIC